MFLGTRLQSQGGTKQPDALATSANQNRKEKLGSEIQSKEKRHSTLWVDRLSGDQEKVGVDKLGGAQKKRRSWGSSDYACRASWKDRKKREGGGALAAQKGGPRHPLKPGKKLKKSYPSKEKHRGLLRGGTQSPIRGMVSSEGTGASPSPLIKLGNEQGETITRAAYLQGS